MLHNFLFVQKTGEVCRHRGSNCAAPGQLLPNYLVNDRKPAMLFSMAKQVPLQGKMQKRELKGALCSIWDGTEKHACQVS